MKKAGNRVASNQAVKRRHKMKNQTRKQSEPKTTNPEQNPLLQCFGRK